jgi:hypothetical protein
MTIGGSEALNVEDRFDIPNDDPVHDKYGLCVYAIRMSRAAVAAEQRDERAAPHI